MQEFEINELVLITNGTQSFLCKKNENGSFTEINLNNVDYSRFLTSTIENEPLGSGVINNVVYISQSNYDLALVDNMIIQDTIYLIIE